MSRLIVEIPEDVTEALRLPPAEQERELRKELAVGLYHRGALALGKASQLANMDRWQFGLLLGTRKIPRHYSDEDLQDDLHYAKRRQ
ncbi:MAG: UPF0175 family protein [Planctomycetota bacterium]